MELDTALFRQIEKSILLDTVYDERKISEQAMQPLLRERCCQALCAIRRVLDEDTCLLYTSPSPRDRQKSRMPSSA